VKNECYFDIKKRAFRVSEPCDWDHINGLRTESRAGGRRGLQWSPSSIPADYLGIPPDGSLGCVVVALGWEYSEI
jgi:hypothetical protein